MQNRPFTSMMDSLNHVMKREQRERMRAGFYSGIIMAGLLATIFFPAVGFAQVHTGVAGWGGVGVGGVPIPAGLTNVVGIAAQGQWLGLNADGTIVGVAGVSNVTAIQFDGTPVALNSYGDSLVVDPLFIGMQSIHPEQSGRIGPSRNKLGALFLSPGIKRTCLLSRRLIER